MVAIVEEKRGEVNQTSSIFGYLTGVLKVIEQQDRRRAMLRGVLFDDKQKSKIIKNYKAIEIIDTIRLASNKKPTLFFEELKAKKGEIGKYDPELVVAIEKSGVGQRIDPIIQRVYDIFTTYPKEMISEHFKRYYRAYHTKLLNLQIKEVGIKLDKLILRFLLNYNIRQNQISKVREFFGYVGRWEAPQNVMLYIREEESFRNYLGKTNDEEIKKLLEESKRTSLLVYYKEIMYFEKLLKQVSIGEKEATWKDFDLFYDKDLDLDGQKISERLEKEFYDINKIEKLQELREKLHKYPRAWKVELRRIIDDLKSELPSRIKRAKEIFRRVLESIARRINDILEKETKDFIEAIKNVIIEVKKVPKRSMNSLLRIVKKKKRIMDGKFEDLRKEYKKKEDKAFPKIAAFSDSLNKFSSEVNIEDFLKDVRGLDTMNRKSSGSIVSTSKMFTGKYPIYDSAVTARLIGLAVGIEANNDRMLEKAVDIRRNTLRDSREIIGKGEAAKKELNILVAHLSNLIKDEGVMKNG